jgi:crossover junction endodeoxyribonuclease RusA
LLSVAVPYPPSANHMKRPRGGGRKGLCSTDEANKYKLLTGWILSGQPIVKGERFEVVLEIVPQDYRKRDVANVEKAVIDAVVRAGIIKDDSLIDDLRLLRRKSNKKEPLVWVHIKAIPEGSTAKCLGENFFSE